MTNYEKIEVLNSLDVIYYEGGDDLLCVLIKSTEENLSKLEEIGFNRNELEIEDNEIDISLLAFELGATYYTGNKFVIDEIQNAIDDLEEDIKKYKNLTKYNMKLDNKILDDLMSDVISLGNAINISKIKLDSGNSDE